jgi:hypothetical protein
VLKYGIYRVGLEGENERRSKVKGILSWGSSQDRGLGRLVDGIKGGLLLFLMWLFVQEAGMPLPLKEGIPAS